MKTALVVIDVQNYFVNEKTKDLPQKIASFIQNSKFDFILFTRFVNKENSNYFKLLNWQKMLTSPDTDIHSSLLKFIKKNNAFEKTSYSIFKARGFVDFLKRNNITKIFLCGIDTDSCVLASAFDGFDLGFDVKVIKNLSLSHSGKAFNEAALKIIDKSIQKN